MSKEIQIINGKACKVARGICKKCIFINPNKQTYCDLLNDIGKDICPLPPGFCFTDSKGGV